MKRVGLFIACVLTAACELAKGGTFTSPTNPSTGTANLPQFVSAETANTLLGTWNGTSTANTGHGASGTLSLTFTNGASLSATGDTSLYADVTWTPNGTNHNYHGGIEGTLQELVVHGDSPEFCHFAISATVVGSTMTGAYATTEASTHPNCLIQSQSGVFSVTKVDTK